MKQQTYILDLPPGCNRHHQDDMTFLGSGIPIFATVTGWGVDPTCACWGVTILSSHGSLLLGVQKLGSHLEDNPS